MTFSGATATPTSWSATSIVAPVPSGATTGNVVVTVSGVASNGVGFTLTGSSSVYYYIEDSLGTSRVITDSSGNLCYDADFYPFGGERTPYANSCPQNYKFTGYERDTESGLDNAQARYDTSTMGRFMSPDWTDATDPIPYADLGDPQSLNLYAYVGNNPLSRNDPTGHYHCDPETSFTDKDGNLHVVAGACHSDPSDFAFAGLLAGGVGHHWIPQAYTKNWQPGWAKDIVSKWTSGPLVKNAKANLNDALQRINNAKVTQIVKDYLARTGKDAEQLTKEDFQAISNDIKTAGGEVEQFGQRLASETPSARDVEAGLENAFKSVEQSGVVQEGEQLIQQGEELIQECGPACSPP